MISDETEGSSWCQRRKKEGSSRCQVNDDVLVVTTYGADVWEGEGSPAQVRRAQLAESAEVGEARDLGRRLEHAQLLDSLDVRHHEAGGRVKSEADVVGDLNTNASQP